MEPSKAQGKRSFKYKMEEEVEEEEEEEEEDDDVSGPLGFSPSAGGDEYMIRKKRPTMMTSNSTTSSINRGRGGSGSSAGGSTVRPLCQADSCNVDLSEAKHYHRRHKICEVHAKAPVVLVGGLQQRFCQQCSRYFVKTLILWERSL